MGTPGRLCSVPDCSKPHRRNDMCDTHDQRMKRTGTTDAPKRQTFAERFWTKVDRRGPDECWLWTAALNEHGYGVMRPDTQRRNGPTVKAHRVSLQLAGIEIEGLYVLHSCDNPPCVNPRHLSTGTAAENSADMVNKGRNARGSRRHTHKLTEAQIPEIRARAAAGELQKVLAAEYGVSRPTISHVVNRRGWLHVPEDPAA
ncbi:helix-turn-helix domain-containing protein [Streptomyces sp. NPDC051658]|uniref:helix-turn-helix domain-containing protein n=1 Tax=Streptomyces sp. NPDC051658 TaxID=3365667 RepID=UPI0037A585B1